MSAIPKTVRVEVGSELGQLLDAAAEKDILLEMEGVRFRLNRVDAPAPISTSSRRRLVPERLLTIIGLGASAHGSNVARLTTTNAALFELHGLLLNRLGRRVALATLSVLRVSQTIVRVRERDETRAEEILIRYEDKDFSLTAALSFAVMERLGIGAAFTLDRHFAQFGWVIIPFAQAR